MGLCGPFGDDAPSGSSSGGGTSAASGPACPEIPPAAFDQSCTVASDCIAVALGNVCVVCIFDGLPALPRQSTSPTKRSTTWSYANSNGTNCGCARPPPVPCCVDGMCQIDSQCPNPVQPTDAGAETGGGSNAGDAGADVVADAATDAAADAGTE